MVYDFLLCAHVWNRAGNQRIHLCGRNLGQSCSGALVQVVSALSIKQYILVHFAEHCFWFKKSIQTLSYLPYFISWVIVAAMLNQLLTPYGGQGPLNKVFQFLSGASEPQYIYGAASAFYPLVLISNIWKGIGWGSIVYLAAISAINSELYEAARLDGAGRFRMMWSITLPSIKTTMGLLFILSLGGLMSAGYDQIYVMKTPANYKYSNVLDIYIIENGLNQGRYEIATAANLFQSLISLILILLGNFILKKTSDVSLW